MGDYFTWLTMPAAAEAETEIELEGEMLSTLAYLIPTGWGAVASFAVFYGIKQIYPEPEAEWVTGDGVYREVPIKWPMPESTVELTVKGDNKAGAYPHTVWLWFLTEPVEQARPWTVISDFLSIMRRLMGLG